MRISRTAIRISLIVFGAIVLVSYVIGVLRTPDWRKLWGGIPIDWTYFIYPCMALATVGFIMFWWTILFSVDEEVIDKLRWPCFASDGSGSVRLFVALCLFLIPSMFWLESTLLNILSPETNYFYAALTISILWIVAIGNIMFGLLAFSAYQDGLQGAKWMLLGSILLAIQCIINDAIIWNVMFPWKKHMQTCHEEEGGMKICE